jgi:protein tyrosine/serine phosphatase
MRAQVYWIEGPLKGRLAILGRPRAGDWLRDEICGWATENINVVVSLLEPEEVLELELDAEGDLCRERGIEFFSFPIPDRGVPASIPNTAELARRLITKIGEGQSVAIHCRAGIGRSALIAACVLVCAGIDVGTVFDQIAAARRQKVPDTDDQIGWLHQFARGRLA